MCANYQPAPPDQLLEHFGVEFTPTYRTESYPGYFSPIIRLNPLSDLMADARECLSACFGIVSPRSKTPHVYRYTYNARNEEIATKASYRSPWKKSQFCIVPALSFYEQLYEAEATGSTEEPLTGDLFETEIIQKPKPKRKPTRWRISHRTGRPLGIAGIWEWCLDKEGNDLYSFSMITIDANDHPLMNQFHEDEVKRMIVILDPSQYEEWLHTPVEYARSFFQQYPAGELVAEPAPSPPRTKKTKSAT